MNNYKVSVRLLGSTPKKYYDHVHAERKARAERNNLEYVDKKADWGKDLWNIGPGYWAMRMIFMGFICLLIGFALLFPR
jgi:hypothetical protein